MMLKMAKAMNYMTIGYNYFPVNVIPCDFRFILSVTRKMKKNYIYVKVYVANHFFFYDNIQF